MIFGHFEVLFLILYSNVINLKFNDYNTFLSLQSYLFCFYFSGKNGTTNLANGRFNDGF